MTDSAIHALTLAIVDGDITPSDCTESQLTAICHWALEQHDQLSVALIRESDVRRNLNQLAVQTIVQRAVEEFEDEQTIERMIQ